MTDLTNVAALGEIDEMDKDQLAALAAEKGFELDLRRSVANLRQDAKAHISGLDMPPVADSDEPIASERDLKRQAGRLGGKRSVLGNHSLRPGDPKYVKNLKTGNVFGATRAFLAREDMQACEADGTSVVFDREGFLNWLEELKEKAEAAKKRQRRGM